MKIYIVLFTFCSLHLSLSVFAENNNSLIDYRTEIKYSGHILETTSYYEIQIDDKDSDWISDISINYSLNDEIELLEAAIYDLNGERIRKVKKDEIVTKSAIADYSMYEDDMVMTFKLKWHEYPYRIRYSYKIKEKEFLFICHWRPILSTSTLTKNASLIVDLPIDYAVNIDSSELFSYSEEILNDRLIRKWIIKNYQLPSSEEFAPPVYELLPNVSIVPENFFYGIEGFTTTWADYGKFHELLYGGLNDLTVDEKATIDQLLEGVVDTKEKIAILYYYMQDNTRYVNVRIDIGGLRPYPASYVCQNKYGDCKALTNYMKSILNYAGIQAYFTTVYAGKKKVKVNRNFPSHQANHIILCIPLENDTLWLENTSKTSPYNYLGSFTQDRSVLFINDDLSCLISTPKLTLEDNTEEYKYYFNISENGEGLLTINGTYRGFLFENYKDLSFYYSKKEQEERFESKLPLKDFEIVSFDLIQEDRDLPEIKSDLNLIIHKQIKKVGNSLIIRLPQLYDYSVEHNDNRHFPIRFPYPIKHVDSLSYQLDFIDQYIVQLPEDVIIESDYGSFSEHFIKNGNNVSAIREFTLLAGEYPKEEYENIYLFLKQVNTQNKKSIILLEAIN